MAEQKRREKIINPSMYTFIPSFPIMLLDDSDRIEAEAIYHSEYCQPDRAIRVAMLESLVLDVSKYNRQEDLHEKHMYNKAISWMMDNNVDWPFSFLNVCEALGMEPDPIRRFLNALGKPVRKHPRARSIPGRRNKLE